MTTRRDQTQQARETYVPSPDSDVVFRLHCWSCDHRWETVGLTTSEGFMSCPDCGRQQVQILDANVVPKA